jgi:hypothetical protein
VKRLWLVVEVLGAVPGYLITVYAWSRFRKGV